MKFSLRKLYKSVSLTLLFVASWATFAHAATQDVRVTNFPTSYSVVNTTWDSRLSTLQTTLQSLAADMSQFPTFVSRFGWNGTMSFSQGFELLYNDVSSLTANVSTLVADTSSSDLRVSFDREFPGTSTRTKTYIQTIESRATSLLQQINGSIPSSNFMTLVNRTSHIDSDLHSIGSTISAINFEANSIKNLVNSNLPAIKVNTDNISVDTDSIDRKTTTLVSITGSILEDANYIMDDTFTLRNFFADNDTIARKDAAEAASGQALDSFTGNGASSASVSDYADISDASTKLNQSFNTGQVGYSDAFQTINSQPSGNNSPWAWFSQATYDSINPQPSRGGSLSGDSYMAFYKEQLASENRKGVSDTPLLDEYNRDIEKAIGK